MRDADEPHVRPRFYGGQDQPATASENPDETIGVFPLSHEIRDPSEYQKILLVAIDLRPTHFLVHGALAFLNGSRPQLARWRWKVRDGSGGDYKFRALGASMNEQFGWAQWRFEPQVRDAAKELIFEITLANPTRIAALSVALDR